MAIKPHFIITRPFSLHIFVMWCSPLHVPCPPKHTCNTSDNQNAGSYRPYRCHRTVFHATKLACEQATNIVHAKGHSNTDAQRVCCAVSCNLFHTRTKSPFKRLIDYDLQHKALFSHSLDNWKVLRQSSPVHTGDIGYLTVPLSKGHARLLKFKHK